MTEKTVCCNVCGEEDNKTTETFSKSKKMRCIKWVVFVLVFAVVVLLFCKGKSEKKSDMPTTEKQPQGISYTPYDVATLFAALRENEVKAAKNFQDQYVEINGFLGDIDGKEACFCVKANPAEAYSPERVTCYFKNDEQREQIKKMNWGNPVTVRGKITEIYWIEYSLAVDSIG